MAFRKNHRLTKELATSSPLLCTMWQVALDRQSVHAYMMIMLCYAVWLCYTGEHVFYYRSILAFLTFSRMNIILPVPPACATACRS